MFNKLKEWLFNSSTFSKYTEAELENKGIKPTEGVKKMEYVRQTLKRLGTIVLLVGFLLVGLTTFFLAKKETANPNSNVTETPHTNGSEKKTQERKSDYLTKTSQEQRSKDAFEAFNKGLAKYSEGETLMEINMSDFESGNVFYSSEELKKIYFNSLKEKFGDSFSDQCYKELDYVMQNNSFVIHADKGLTFVSDSPDVRLQQADKVAHFFVDMEKPIDNTKLVLTKQFEYEMVDWREGIKTYPKFKSVFPTIDWEKQKQYEVVPVRMKSDTRNLPTTTGVFVLMCYNETLKKWQVEGFGGVS